MKSFQHIVTDKNGIHGRPAASIVSECKKYESKITILYNGKHANAKRILSTMSLSVKTNEKIIIMIEGLDEDKACEKLLKFFQLHI